MKLAHLQLEDVFGNKRTLICYLECGSIQYSLYSGHTSSGQALSLDFVSKSLPVDKINSKETKSAFKKRLIEVVKSAHNKIVNDVNVNIKF